VHFHSNVEELYDYFPRSILPVELGEDLKETIEENWQQALVLMIIDYVQEESDPVDHEMDEAEDNNNKSSKNSQMLMHFSALETAMGLHLMYHLVIFLPVVIIVSKISYVKRIVKNVVYNERGHFLLISISFAYDKLFIAILLAERFTDSQVLISCIISEEMFSEASNITSESNGVLPFKMKRLPNFVLKKLKEELKKTPETKKSLLKLRKMLIDIYEEKVTFTNLFQKIWLYFSPPSPGRISLAFAFALKERFTELQELITCVISKEMSSESSETTSYSNETLPFKMKHLPDFVLRKLKEELKETPETKLKSLLELRKMLRDEQLTSGIDFQEDFLVQFLRHNKYDVGKAFYYIGNTFRLRRKYPLCLVSLSDEIFRNEEINKTMVVLPKRCPEGCTLVIIRFVHHLKICTPHNLYLLYHKSLHCIPGRYKAFHLVNQSLVVKPCWMILKPFLSEKLRNRKIGKKNPSLPPTTSQTSNPTQSPPPPAESSDSEIEDEDAGKSNPTAVGTPKNRIPPIFVNPPDNWCTLISI
ncbi:alpha-tocopherol transfer protein-like, partial [Trichonephila inaurata madagascariensis]